MRALSPLLADPGHSVVVGRVLRSGQPTIWDLHASLRPSDAIARGRARAAHRQHEGKSIFTDIKTHAETARGTGRCQDAAAAATMHAPHLSTPGGMDSHLCELSELIRQNHEQDLRLDDAVRRTMSGGWGRGYSPIHARNQSLDGGRPWLCAALVTQPIVPARRRRLGRGNGGITSRPQRWHRPVLVKDSICARLSTPLLPPQHHMDTRRIT